MPSRASAWLVAPALLIVGLAPGPLLPPARGAEAAAIEASRQAPLPERNDLDPITGQRSRLPRDWVGVRPEQADTPILVLAGHADSQGMAGSGTSGAAVAAGGAPMLAGISDELYWNIVVAEAVLALGQQRGLRISYHRPPFRTIRDGDDPGTNWSVGRQHAASGGYALEIHFDAWGPSGIGSGLIPPLHRPFGRLDESLAEAFGGYPMAFRGGLGGPRRGIALLEVGKLEGALERSLRNPATRADTVTAIAERIVTALEIGLGRSPGPAQTLSPQPGVVGSAPPGQGLPASSAGR